MSLLPLGVLGLYLLEILDQICNSVQFLIQDVRNSHNSINNSHDLWYFLISHKACLACLSLFNFLSSFCFSNFACNWALVFLLAFQIILFGSLLGICSRRVFSLSWVFHKTSCYLSFLGCYSHSSHHSGSNLFFKSFFFLFF